MNKFVSKTVSALAVAAALSTSAMAQESQFGVGVGVTSLNSNAVGVGTTTIRGTVTLEDGLRLEPYLGFGYANPDGSDSVTDINLGSALHMVKPVSAKINAYYGGYIGLDSLDTGSVSYTTFNLGPVAGVEYSFDPQFTLGAEVSVNVGFGDITSVGTKSAVLLRYYF